MLGCHGEVAVASASGECVAGSRRRRGRL